MSHYDDDPPRRRKSHRTRERDRPVYEEEVYESRGSRGAGARQKALVRRPRDDDSDSVEEVHRDFPPGGGAYVKSRQRRAKSANYGDDYYEPRRRHRGDWPFTPPLSLHLLFHRLCMTGARRRGYSSSSSSESPPPSRRKSLGEQALAALGIGGAAAAASGRGKSRDRSRGGGRGRRRDSYSSYSSRSRSRSVDQKEKIQQAVKAALTAGAVEAFRSRKEPGAWTGDKGKRVLTAAIGAGGVNRALTSNRDPEKKDGRHGIEAVLGGLATNHLINGGRSRSRSRHGRGRNEKESGGGIKGLAAGGLAAAAGKALLDARARSKSRGRRDSSSDDSRGPRKNKRSSSVGAYLEKGMEKGMAALGLKDEKKPRESRRHRRYDDDDGYYSRGAAPTQGRLRGGGGDYDGGVRGGSSSSDDDVSSSEDDRIRKKMGRKELITAGLASVATIHAAHSVYTSIEARDKRHKLVAEGELSPEEAKRLKNKARLQDAASIGIAALGIKGAVSEWKEMQEQRQECLEFDEKRKERHERRLRKQEERLRLAKHPPYPSSEPQLERQGYAPLSSSGMRYQHHDSGGSVPPPPMGPPPSAHY
ncbi:MAG: hypothetical protein Q9211_006609 [Gyalolechia sp. 1 TL-2023]